MKRIFVLFFAMFSLMMNYSCSSDMTVPEHNPLLAEWTSDKNIPPFDKIRTEHYEPAFEVAMKMHNDEIAAIVGITVKNVSVRLFRIKEELKKMSNH